MSERHLKAVNIDGDFTARQNTSTGETDMSVITLPARALDNANDAIHVVCWGTVANNANAKTLTLYLGASNTQAFVLKASVATAWRLDAWIVSTGANAQQGIATLTHGVIAASQQDNFSLAFTAATNGPLTLKTTGTGGATADILQAGFLVQT